MNNFSEQALKALFAQETDKIFYLLLEIDPDEKSIGYVSGTDLFDLNYQKIGYIEENKAYTFNGVIFGKVQNNKVVDINGREIVYVYNSNEYENGEPRIIEHQGNKYVACPFDINLPAQGIDASTELTLVVANVDRSLTESIRSQTTPFLITMKVVMSDDLQRVEAGPWRMKLVSCTADAITIEGTIIADRFMDSAFPYHRMDKSNFPGMG